MTSTRNTFSTKYTLGEIGRVEDKRLQLLLGYSYCSLALLKYLGAHTHYHDSLAISLAETLDKMDKEVFMSKRIPVLRGLLMLHCPGAMRPPFSQGAWDRPYDCCEGLPCNPELWQLSITSNGQQLPGQGSTVLYLTVSQALSLLVFRLL